MKSNKILFKFLPFAFCALLLGCPNFNMEDMGRYVGSNDRDADNGPVDAGQPVTVTYDLNLSYATGTIPTAPDTLKSGDTYEIVFPEDITFGTTAYRFVGWNTEKKNFKNGTSFKKNGTKSITLDRDVTLYAEYEGLWKAGVIGYNGEVTYDDPDETNPVPNPNYGGTWTGIKVFSSNESGIYSNNNKPRIPTLFSLPNGDLLAFGDRRMDGSGDVAGDATKIATVVKWSHDDGKTWSTAQDVFSTKTQLNGTNSRGDAGVVYDRINDKIVVMTVGYRGLWYGKAGETSKIWMRRGSIKYDDTGHVSGFNWEKERDITGYFFGDMNSDVGVCSDTERSKMYAGFVASGSGLQLQKGPYAGRIMFSIAIRRAPWLANNATGDNGGKGANVSYAIYSDDFGTTWKVSKNSPTSDGAETMTRGNGYGDEASIAELPNGKLIMAVRPSGVMEQYFQRIISYSDDYGTTWSPGTKHEQLPSSASVGGLLMYTTKDAGWEEDIILGNWDVMPYRSINNGITSVVSQANRATKVIQQNGNPAMSSMFVSYDNGTNWAGRNWYHKGTMGESGYSSFTVLRDGSIGVLIENGCWGGNDMLFYRLTLDWVTDGSTKGSYHPKRAAN